MKAASKCNVPSWMAAAAPGARTRELDAAVRKASMGSGTGGVERGVAPPVHS